ncbi:MAG: glycosyltransferase [Planctomycetota bacterium]
MDASSRMVDDPVRVAHIVATLGVGGIERWLLQVASAIDRRRVQLDVIVHDPKTGALEHPIRQTGSRVLRCPPPSRPIAWATALRHHLEAGGYDVVHAHPYRFCGPILWVSRRSGVPVRIAHSRNALPAPPWIRPHARLFEHAARRVILREMTLGLAVSSTAAAALFGGGWTRDRRIRLMPSAIDLDLFRKLPRLAPTRADLGIPEDAIVVGHCGGFRPVKNHAKLLEAFASFRRSTPSAAMVLIGDGPLRPTIERTIRASGDDRVVHCLGHQDDVPAVLNSLCDVCVLPSLWEGLPRVVAEAVGVGLPVVISEHLAPELDYLPDRVWRVPASAPGSAWAESIVRAAASGRYDRRACIDALAAAGLDLSEQAHRLANLYSTAVHG